MSKSGKNIKLQEGVKAMLSSRHDVANALWITVSSCEYLFKTLLGSCRDGSVLTGKCCCPSKGPEFQVQFLGNL